VEVSVWPAVIVSEDGLEESVKPGDTSGLTEEFTVWEAFRGAPDNIGWKAGTNARKANAKSKASLATFAEGGCSLPVGIFEYDKACGCIFQVDLAFARRVQLELFGWLI
jgi:hypothetical protein